MKRCLMILTMMVMAGQASAQCRPPEPEPEVEIEEEVEDPDPPPPPDEIVQVVPPTMRMTSNIAFIIDTSGSMDNGGRVGMAITFARSLVERPQDQLMVSFFSFKDSHTRWPGLTEEEESAAREAGTLGHEEGDPPPKGWVYFPGVPQLESAQRWLTGCGASGGTNPVSALNEALAENINDLTIVLITDGDDFNVPLFLQSVQAGQAARVQRGQNKAVIFVIGVGPNANQRQHLVNVGRSEGGGMFVVRRPPPPEPPAPDLDGIIPPLHGPWQQQD